MIFIKSFLISMLISGGILCTFTDIKYGKIPNKAIIVGIASSIIGNIMYFAFLLPELLKDFLINLTASLLISFIMYWFRIWAAGDVKFFVMLFSLLPSDIFYNKPPMPVVTVFILVFSLAFIYLCAESIVLMIKKEKIITYYNTKISLLSILLCSSFIITCHSIFQIIFGGVYYEYLPVFLLGNIVLILLYNTFNLHKSSILMVMCILFSISSTVISIINNKYRLELYSIICTCVIMIFRYIAEQFNYKEIYTCDVKEGMVLSYSTVALMSKSRVKGLPKYTTEDMASRLTEEEAKSVCRWGLSKYGKEKVTIVRKLPFACFIFLGVLIYLARSVILW